VNEGELRSRYPEIPWDQPVHVSVLDHEDLQTWVCRYCIALHGLKAQDIIHSALPDMAFASREDALEHIDRAHHD
jgi:hypothetical protein